MLTYPKDVRGAFANSSNEAAFFAEGAVPMMTYP